LLLPTTNSTGIPGLLVFELLYSQIVAEKPEGASLQRVQRRRDTVLPKQNGQLSWSWRDLQGVEMAVPVGHCVNLGE
jgi:hypothetical protein